MNTITSSIIQIRQTLNRQKPEIPIKEKSPNEFRHIHLESDFRSPPSGTKSKE